MVRRVNFPQIFLAAGNTNARTESDLGSPVNVMAWANQIRDAGLFAEVLLFVDGRNMPTDLEPSGQAHQLRLLPSAPPKASHFYVVARSQGGVSPDTIDAPSDFAIALLDGLHSKASNTSGQVTGESLRAFLAYRVPFLAEEHPDTPTSVTCDGDFSMLIAEKTSASPL